MTPPTSPRLILAMSAALGRVPDMPVITVWPTRRSSDDAGAGAALGARTQAERIAARAALRRDMHFARDQHAVDLDVVVEHHDVRGEPHAQAAELAEPERAGR